MLSNKYHCKLTTIARKQIMFEGRTNGKCFVACTPGSKLHKKGSGWFDLNMAQVGILDDADISVLAVRLEGSKVYYIDFKEFRKMITPEFIVFSPGIGEHWKFFVWESHIEIQGNRNKYFTEPELVS
ncbi:hypothetical protein [Paenibacillus odorifer]|uniref:hypothetical protein n=1 Tax=Paenibacillus TaxID=44249 RepID=UPI0011329262|nr:hypothetical protein [Paenibacillus odorifer]